MRCGVGFINPLGPWTSAKDDITVFHTNVSPAPHPPLYSRPHPTNQLPSIDTWDPKITTPPGLYLVGTAVLWAVGKVQALLHGAATPSAPSICAPGQLILPYLRPINAAFNLGTFLMIYRLMYRTRKVGWCVG